MQMIKELIDKYESRKKYLYDKMYFETKTDLHSNEYEVMRSEWLTITKLLPELYEIYHTAINQKPFKEFAGDFLDVMMMYRENAEIIHEENLCYLHGYLHGIDEGIGRFNSISKLCEGKWIM
jgi:hypothetical protein